MEYLNEIKDFFDCNINEINYISNDENCTKDFAKTFAKFLKKCDILSLNGELGSGKTVFMKGIANYFSIENEVSSPTFTIVNEYNNKYFPIFHFDVYRIENSAQFESSIGLDYFELGLCIIEWGEIIQDILPKGTILICINKLDENKRNINIRRK